MKKNTIVSVSISSLLATLVVSGVAFASTAPASGNASLLNQGTVEVDSLKVGKQGTGGVTFFNGTIINATTNDGAEVPVTFGDDVRIDGRVWRGEVRGPGDSKPFIVDDDFQVNGSFSVNGRNILNEIDGISGVSGSTTPLDLSSVYTKAEIEALNAEKVNVGEVYSKAEVDAQNAGKLNSGDVYSKSEIDSRDLLKANVNDVYSKSEVNGLLSTKAEASHNHDSVYERVGRTGARSISFTQFIAADESYNYSLVPGVGLKRSNGGSQTWFAPIDLDNKSTLTKISILAEDSDGGENSISFMPKRQNNATGEVTNLSSMKTTTNNGGVHSVVFDKANLGGTGAFIDNSTTDSTPGYSYFLQIDFSGATTNGSVLGVELTFDHPPA